MRAANSAPNKSRKKQPRRLALFAAASTLLVPLALFAAYRQAETRRASPAWIESAHAAQAKPSPRLPEQEVKDTAWDPGWPSLPGSGKPAQPIEHVRALYAFAAHHPEVLQYAHCYCGCERVGHKSARDCFVKGRDKNGRPQWDGMGFT
jgi:hypothetical protein